MAVFVDVLGELVSCGNRLLSLKFCVDTRRDACVLGGAVFQTFVQGVDTGRSSLDKQVRSAWVQISSLLTIVDCFWKASMRINDNRSPPVRPNSKVLCQLCAAWKDGEYGLSLVWKVIGNSRRV